MMPSEDNKNKKAQAMPKWLLYGLIAKGILVTCVVVGVLWYAGILK